MDNTIWSGPHTGLNQWGVATNWAPPGVPDGGDSVGIGTTTSAYQIYTTQLDVVAIHSLNLGSGGNFSVQVTDGGSFKVWTTTNLKAGDFVITAGATGDLGVTSVDADSSINDDGLLYLTSLDNHGAVNVRYGKMFVQSVTGDGTISISRGGFVEITGADTGTVSFADKAANKLMLDAGTSFGGTITGLSGSNAVELRELTYSPTYTINYNSASHVMHIMNGATTLFTFNDITSKTGSFVLSADVDNQLQVSATCYLRGTRIATLRGDVTVEELRIGDLLVIATGGALPITWIGTRSYVSRLVAADERAGLMPIRIAAGALGGATPVRDLFVSPEHMMCLDDVLVPAGKLLNGTTITQVQTLDVVDYFHIELPRHAVIYAEGAPAESYRDTGNRNTFANVLSYLGLARDDGGARPAPCLPIVTEGLALEVARAALTARAAGAAPLAGEPMRLSA